jgi:hypothetical protein
MVNQMTGITPKKVSCNPDAPCVPITINWALLRVAISSNTSFSAPTSNKDLHSIPFFQPLLVMHLIYVE